MKDTFVQLTLRRLADIFSSPRLYLMFALAVLFVTTFHPTGIFGEQPFVRRLGFAVAANAVLWSMGILITAPTRIFLELKGFSRTLATSVGFILSLLCLFPVFNWIMKWELGETPPFTWLFEAYILIGLSTVLIIYLLLIQKSPRVTSSESSASPRPHHTNPLLQRLPAEKQGVLLALVAQDHYVEVITQKGSVLILMRLSDAVALGEDENGIQIHRSVWVSQDGLQSIKRDGRKTLVVLPNGRELPVARSAQHDVKQYFQSKQVNLTNKAV